LGSSFGAWGFRKIGSPRLVVFVIPVRDDAARLAHCLASIHREDAAADIVVVDHGSTDGSDAIALDHRARVLRTPEAINVAALRNIGSRSVDARYLALIDADNTIGPGWLSAFTEAVNTDAPAVLGAPYSPPPAPTWVQAWYDGLRDHATRVQPAEWLGAGNLVVRRDAFEAVGGFDESLETCEDVDLCFKLTRAGYTILNVPGMRSIHHGDPPTLGRLFRSELWRGRDNIRVSLRQRPMSFRNALSVVMPIAQLGLMLGAITGALAGAVLGSTTGWRMAAVCLLGVALLVAARAALIYRRAGAKAPGGVPAAVAIAATYETARAAALVMRAGHHRRPTPKDAA
jgi:GT2 family glycosyltransferase